MDQCAQTRWSSSPLESYKRLPFRPFLSFAHLRSTQTMIWYSQTQKNCLWKWVSISKARSPSLYQHVSPTRSPYVGERSMENHRRGRFAYCPIMYDKFPMTQDNLPRFHMLVVIIYVLSQRKQYSRSVILSFCYFCSVHETTWWQRKLLPEGLCGHKSLTLSCCGLTKTMIKF